MGETIFKIGEFSKINHVTVRTLRHYEERGLIRPAETDRFTGYRYYTADQLAVMEEILAYKRMGFSLDTKFAACWETACPSSGRRKSRRSFPRSARRWTEKLRSSPGGYKIREVRTRWNR